MVETIAKPATPLPWHAYVARPQTVTANAREAYVGWITGGHFPQPVTGDKGAVIGVKAADGEYLVHAANAYPRLVAALQNLRRCEHIRKAVAEAGTLLRELGERDGGDKSP